MASRLPPKAMAKQLGRVLRSQHPDAHYRKKVFQPTRALLDVGPARPAQRLPALLTDAALVAFDATIWQAHQLAHGVMLTLLLFTGSRNAARAQRRVTDVELQTGPLRITPGKGPKARYGRFPSGVRGALAQYLAGQRRQSAISVFASNRGRPYSTRRLRQMVKKYATAAGMAKRVYPHLFRHQRITYRTKQGMIRPKLPLRRGPTAEQSLAVYRELALSDVAAEYAAALPRFPVR